MKEKEEMIEDPRLEEVMEQEGQEAVADVNPVEAVEENIEEAVEEEVKETKTWFSKITKYIPQGIPCLLCVGALFYYIGSVMGVSQMLNTIMHYGSRPVAQYSVLSYGHLRYHRRHRPPVCGVWRCEVA